LVKEYKNCSFNESLEYLAKLGNLETELEESRKEYIQSLNKENILKKKN